MDYNMNFWILTILDMSTKLDYYADNLEKRAEGLSVCLTKDTLSLFNEIMDLNNKKIKLINFKVMYDSVIATLKKDERIIMEEYAKNQTLEEIGKLLDVNKSTVMRRMNKAILKCGAVLTALGYTSKKLFSEYGDYAAVYYTFTKIKNEHRLRQAASKKKSEAGTVNENPERPILHDNVSEYVFEKTVF